VSGNLKSAAVVPSGSMVEGVLAIGKKCRLHPDLSSACFHVARTSFSSVGAWMKLEALAPIPDR
jgi:hypothetical protein